MTRYEGQIKALEQVLVAKKLQASLAKEQARKNILQVANRGLSSAAPAEDVVIVPQAGLAALHVALTSLRSHLADKSLQKDRAVADETTLSGPNSAIRVGGEALSYVYSAEASRREYEDLFNVQKTLSQELEAAERKLKELDHKVLRLTEVNSTLRQHAEHSQKQKTARPAVGQKVAILTGNHAGQITRIVKDDKDFKPYQLEGLDGHFREEDVRLVPESEASTLDLTASHPVICPVVRPALPTSALQMTSDAGGLPGGCPVVTSSSVL